MSNFISPVIYAGDKTTFKDSVTQTTTVRDIGVMGLASHDLFAWNHRKKMNKENGRLDLSTIFGNTFDGYYVDGDDWFQQANWKHGGNKKNSENAPVYTVSQTLVHYFENLLSQGTEPDQARLKTLILFQSMVADSFERLTQLSFPRVQTTTSEAVNNQEQASMRILHDILPGNILLKNGETFKVTNVETAKTLLCEDDLNCAIKSFDGNYDSEYNDIRIPISKKPKIMMKLDLEKIDDKFIENAGLDYELAAQQLKEVGEGKRLMSDTYFVHYLIELFTKAQSTMNTDGTTNVWTSKVVEHLSNANR